MTGKELITAIKKNKSVKENPELKELVRQLGLSMNRHDRRAGKYCDVIDLMSDGMEYYEAMREVKLI